MTTSIVSLLIARGDLMLRIVKQSLEPRMLKLTGHVTRVGEM